MKSLHQPPREQPIRPSASRLRGGFFFGASHDEYRSSQGRGRALLGKYAHTGRTHPGFLHGMAVGSVLSRAIRVSPRALRRWSSSLCRAVHRGGFRARRNHLNCGIVGTLMSGGGIGAIFLAFPIPLGSTNVLFNVPNAAAFGRPSPKCPVAAEPANEAAGEAKITKNAKATFNEVLDTGEAPL
jgi:hypothetical protein